MKTEMRCVMSQFKMSFVVCRYVCMYDLFDVPGSWEAQELEERYRLEWQVVPCKTVSTAYVLGFDRLEA